MVFLKFGLKKERPAFDNFFSITKVKKISLPCNRAKILLEALAREYKMPDL